MKEAIKRILKRLGIYHPLQSSYRAAIRFFTRARLRRQYESSRGSGYTCNFCHSSYTSFAPWYPEPENRAANERNAVVAGYGENIICPSCLSTARERLVKAMLETSFTIDGQDILHLSPEKPLYDFISPRARVTTADYTPGFYKNISTDIRFADATGLPFADASFDLVIANHIMEHIPDDRKAMREILRVLKPGGAAIMQVPFSIAIRATLEEPGINDPARQSALFGQKDHVRIYKLSDYLQRLREAGFEVDYLPYEYLHKFFQYAIQPFEGFIN
ncbi:MAG: class I SAM-dependent methyltransferase, partial [Bacteroidetes bacterium]|nr:class I SAM-dependent methyltransferase [Bacteroidota bacterium]